MLSVSTGICEAYKKNFGVDPLLYRSTPNSHDLVPSVAKDNQIRMVHHGIANRNRQLQKMISLMDYLDDRFTLDMYLTGSPKYIDYLKSLAKDSRKVRICRLCSTSY